MKFNELSHVIICVKLYLGSQGAFRGSGKTTGQMQAQTTKLTIIFKGNCADNSTGHAKLYLKSQVKVTKDFQDYTFLRWIFIQKKKQLKARIKS